MDGRVAHLRAFSFCEGWDSKLRPLIFILALRFAARRRWAERKDLFSFFPASELAGYCHMSLAGIWSEEKGYRRSRINSFLLAEGKSINADFTSAR
jgi:hypothetical protein